MADVDAIFQALADSKRRYVLMCLQDHHTVSLADVAEFVAEHEYETEITDLSDELVREVYFSLYHTHIPKLEAVSLVHYEQETDIVAKTEHTGQSLLKAHDSVTELIHESSN
jgi:DNA-binding transcriptional ArsR family regulator